MRIRRNPLLVAKSLTKSTIKKLSAATLATVLVAGGVLLAQNLTTPDRAMAATPPDNCFAFNAATKTITDYYDHRADNPANPACPQAVDVPSTIGGVAVTAIGGSAFYSNQLTSITIPNSVIAIGNYAFQSNQLTSITIDGDPANIGTEVLSGNPIESISYNGVSYTSSQPVGESCYGFSAGTITGFYQADIAHIKTHSEACLKHDIDIPSTIGGVAVTAIGNYAFQSNQLTSITIPNSVTTIGNSAFQSNQLTSITIPNSVTTIDGFAFRDNQLASVTISSNTLTAGSYAFGVNEITSIVIDSTSVAIDVDAFAYNKVPIESITYNGTTYTAPTTQQLLPESCLDFSAGTINDYYYAGINHIASHGSACLATDIVIPDTIGGQPVTSLGQDAFRADNLTAATMPTTVVSIGTSAFVNNKIGEITIPPSVVSIGRSSFNGNPLNSISFPSSVKTIGEYAFAHTKLTTVTIPDSVTSIGDFAFEHNLITTAYIGKGIASLTPDVFARQIDYDRFGGSYDDWDDALYSEDAAQFKAAQDAILLTNVYPLDSANPNGLRSSLYFETYTEADGDGDYDDTAVFGGYIVKPSSLTLNYRNSGNQSLQIARTLTGERADNTYMSSYYLSDLPAIPEPANSTNSYPSPVLTPTEQTAIDQALSAYYSIGDTVTITPPTIDGYITPAAKTFTLSNPENQGNFTYQKILTKVDFSKPSGSTSNPTANSVPSGLDPAIANSAFTVDTAEQCSTIDTARLLPASDFTAPDATYTSLGGLDFTLSCTEPGKEASVSLSLGTQVAEPSTLKIYKQTAGNKVTDITNQTIITNQAGKTTISYNLTDGGELDDDGTVNGEITDPVFIAVPADSELLADTGDSQQVIALLAVATILIGPGLVYVSRKSAARG